MGQGAGPRAFTRRLRSPSRRPSNPPRPQWTPRARIRWQTGRVSPQPRLFESIHALPDRSRTLAEAMDAGIFPKKRLLRSQKQVSSVGKCVSVAGERVFCEKSARLNFGRAFPRRKRVFFRLSEPFPRNKACVSTWNRGLRSSETRFFPEETRFLDQNGRF